MLLKSITIYTGELTLLREIKKICRGQHKAKFGLYVLAVSDVCKMCQPFSQLVQLVDL